MGVKSSHTAGGRVRKPASRRGPARRVASLLTVALASTVVVTAAAVASAKPASLRVTALNKSSTPRPARSLPRARPRPPSASPSTSAAPSPSARPSAALTPPANPAPSGVPVLTALDRRQCPATAAACVDLTRHVTWLQSGGAVSFGPVWMEPGPPGSAHATPRGTFQVAWKAGPGYISTIYGDPMPWAVFFAPGGIAFHGGSLTVPSHGCVHLTIANARYYNEHLPVGAKVAVF
jgi:lipoprotein-anchoring transpeptidase ErfK/SrfK